MSKLLRFKEWVTPNEAARHLSHSLDEPVSEADVFKFGLDEKLRFSARFPNGVGAIKWEEISESEARRLCDLSSRPGCVLDRWNPQSDADGRLIVCHESKFLHESDGQGASFVWFDNGAVLDLSMIGSEQLEFANEFEHLFEGGEIFHATGGKCIVTDLDGALFTLREFSARATEEEIAAGARTSGGVTNRSVRHLLNCGSFVIRPSSLARFLNQIEEPKVANFPKSNLGARERDTLLKLVIGMAISGYGHSPDAARSDAPAEIASDLIKLGINMTDDTVRKWLKEAAKTVLPARPPKS
jgi:hypothetical protein